MKRLLLFMLCVPLVLSALAQAEHPHLQVTGAWVRPTTEATSAGYLQIRNYAEQDDQLLTVTSEQAMMTELHEVIMDGDIMRMRQVEAIDIPAGETVALQPNGLRIMLMGLSQPLIEGETLPLTLNFVSGVVVTVEALITFDPIPYILPSDALTERALEVVQDGYYVGQVVNPPIQVHNFSAPSSDEAVTQFSDLDGKWRMVFFGYIRCPDFCPMTLISHRRAKELLGDLAEAVTFVLVSVDADRDTPEALARYLLNFDPEFVAFSADDETLRRIQPDYGFYYERRMNANSLAVYTIDHSTRSYLIDPDGVLRASFAYDTSPNALAGALSWYINQTDDE